MVEALGDRRDPQLGGEIVRAQVKGERAFPQRAREPSKWDATFVVQEGGRVLHHELEAQRLTRQARVAHRGIGGANERAHLVFARDLGQGDDEARRERGGRGFAERSEERRERALRTSPRGRTEGLHANPQERREGVRVQRLGHRQRRRLRMSVLFLVAAGAVAIFEVDPLIVHRACVEARLQECSHRAFARPFEPVGGSVLRQRALGHAPHLGDRVGREEVCAAIQRVNGLRMRAFHGAAILRRKVGGVAFSSMRDGARPHSCRRRKGDRPGVHGTDRDDK